MFRVFLSIVYLLGCSPAMASQITKKQIVNPAACTARGLANSVCLPDDTQTYVTANGINNTLNAAIIAGSIGGGGGGGNTGKNYLANQSFEVNSGASFTSWTVSGATASANTSNFHDGSQSMSLVLSAAGSVSQDVTPSVNLSGTNLEAGVYVNTTVTGVSVCARVNGVNVACNAVPSSGQWTYVNANIVGPAQGTSIGIAVVWTGSSGTVLVDGPAWAGNATNLSNVSQAQYVGSITYSGCGSNNFSSSASSWTNMGAITGCTISVDGQVSAPGTQIPGLVLSNGVRPGTYIYQLDAVAGNSTNYFEFRISDGTNATPGFATAAFGDYHINGNITYSTAISGPVTIQVQGQGIGGGSGALYVDNAHISALTLKVYYFPSQSQTAVQSNCASTGSCVNHLSASVTASCTSTPCTIASQNVPWISSIVRNSTGNYTANFNTGFFSNTPICNGTSYNGGVAPVTQINSTSPTSITFATFGVNGSSYDSTFNISCDKQGSDQSSMSAPVLVGSVTSKASQAMRTTAATISSVGSSCTVSNNYEGDITSAYNANGRCSVTFSTPFANVPICNWTAFDNGASVGSLWGTISSSGGSWGVQITQSSNGAPQNGGSGMLFCYGPR